MRVLKLVQFSPGFSFTHSQLYPHIFSFPIFQSSSPYDMFCKIHSMHADLLSLTLLILLSIDVYQLLLAILSKSFPFILQLFDSSHGHLLYIHRLWATFSSLLFAWFSFASYRRCGLALPSGFCFDCRIGFERM